MQRRRHRLMMRRSTVRGSSKRRSLTTAFVVIFGAFAIMIGGSVLGTAGGLLAAYNYFASGLPEPDILDGLRLPQSTFVYDRTGATLLARVECQNRDAVPYEDIPEALINATVATEDRTFWTNDGVDYYAALRAVYANLQAGGIVQGASTLTQQMIDYAEVLREQQADTPVAPAASGPISASGPAEPLDPSAAPTAATEEAEQEVCTPPEPRPDPGIDDKIREQIFAREVTAAYPGEAGKKRIITTYLNLVFYGNGSYGVKAAAANYFGITDLAELTLAQSSFLAGLPQLPSVYDPYQNSGGEPGSPEAAADAIERRGQVLDAMLREGYITKAEHDQADAVSWLDMSPKRAGTPLREPHFTFAAEREAEQILAALDYPDPAYELRTGGFRITTTIDLGLQEQAHLQVQKWVAALSDKNVGNGALVAVNSATGEIVAYIGSVDYYNRDDPRVDGQFDVAGLGRRQPGSAFKPITYSSAFRARDATPATFFVDSVTQFGQTLETSYLPTNADVTDHGPLLAADGLRYSLNTPSVMMQYLVGADTTAEFAESMGVAPADYIMGLDPGLTLTLGSVPVSLKNMTQAYSVFAQQGALHPATTIREIRDRDNRIIYSLDTAGPEVTNPLTTGEAFLTHWILEGNTDPARNSVWGSRAELRDASGVRRQAGFKTGTTNDFRDVSGFGYVPGGLTVGVWMGNNNQEALSNRLGQGLFSADGPLYLWHDFMTIALNQPWEWNGKAPVGQTTFAKPGDVQMVDVCKFSGLRATNDCGELRNMPFLEGTVPPPDTFHSKGCFDIVAMVNADDRRPDEWVESAQRWADRYVNGQTSAKGDPADMGRLGPDKVWMRIGPVPGNSGFGASICGQRRSTPQPSATAPPSGGPTPGPTDNCNGNNPNCATPAPTLQAAPTGAVLPPPSGGALVPIFGGPMVLSAAALGWRRMRRRPKSGS
ncbi:MAG: transglycosylase domain-containing protein [Chloroflexota bacterium]